MTVFVTHKDSIVVVQARAEGPGIIGDAVWTVKPGGSLLGHPYERWAALPIGRNEVELKPA